MGKSYFVIWLSQCIVPNNVLFAMNSIEYKTTQILTRLLILLFVYRENGRYFTSEASDEEHTYYKICHRLNYIVKIQNIIIIYFLHT